jgi:hypothetical protein
LKAVFVKALYWGKTFLFPPPTYQIAEESLQSPQKIVVDKMVMKIRNPKDIISEASLNNVSSNLFQKVKNSK